jgi:hypothetical protein
LQLFNGDNLNIGFRRASLQQKRSGNIKSLAGLYYAFIYFAVISARAIYYYVIQRLRQNSYNVDSVFVVYTKGANVIKFDDTVIVGAGFQVDIKYQIDSPDKKL